MEQHTHTEGTVNEQEMASARAHLQAKRGLRMNGQPYRFGERVQYRGEEWIAYDHEAYGNGSVVVLWNGRDTFLRMV